MFQNDPGPCTLVCVEISLTTVNGYVSLLAIMAGCIALAFTETFATFALVGPMLVLFFYLSGPIDINRKNVVGRVHSAMFSPVDLISWYELFVAVYPSADAPAQQEGAIIIVAIALTILARYGAIMTMALAFSGESPY